MDDLDEAINKFLYELTELCRRHGMYMDKDSYMAHGETYEYLKVEYFGSGTGTEAYYYIDEEGNVCFDSPDGQFMSKADIGINPPVDDVSAFNSTKKRIDKLFEIRYEEVRKANNKSWEQYMVSRDQIFSDLTKNAPPRKPSCNCGKTFSTDVKRDKHCGTTGHSPNPFGC